MPEADIDTGRFPPIRPHVSNCHRRKNDSIERMAMTRAVLCSELFSVSQPTQPVRVEI
jgi:hypothetical protein